MSLLSFTYSHLALLVLGLCGTAIAANRPVDQPSSPPASPAQTVGLGIGLSIDDNDSVWIEQVLPGSPAERAGVRAGDELLAVDGQSVAGAGLDVLAGQLRGPVDTEVSVTLRAPQGKARKLTLRRAVIAVPAAPSPPPSPAPNQPQPSLPPTDSPNPATQGAAAAAAPASPAAGLRFTRISVQDPGINNIEAISFLIPAGWQVQGGMKWFPDYSILANLLMRITDPQTGAQIEFLPLQNFTWLNQMVGQMRPGSNYMGNILWQPINDIPQFVQTMYAPEALRHLQHSRAERFEDLPKVAEEVARQFGGQGQVKAGRVRYQYELNGQPWEEDVYVTLSYFPWQLGTIWSVNSAYSFRAPRGQLDRLTPIMNTTIVTARLSPDWYGGYRYVQKLFNDRMNNSIRNAKALSDTITRNSEQIRQMYADSYRERQASQDRINQKWSEYIRGVDTYADPFQGQQVQLPSGYNDVWVSSTGEYLLSNQAGFDPNVGSTQTWRRMDHPAAQRR